MAKKHHSMIKTLTVLLVGIGLIHAPLALGQDTKSLDIGKRWGKYLTLLQEPDLAGTGDGRDVWRVLWLRSFHPAVAVRVVRDGDSLSIITSQLRPLDSARTALRRDSVPVPLAVWDDIHRSDAARQIWTTVAPLWEGISLDGALWILEAREGNRYHAVEWWSPSEEPNSYGYRILVLQILSMGGVRVPPDAVY